MPNIWRFQRLQPEDLFLFSLQTERLWAVDCCSDKTTRLCITLFPVSLFSSSFQREILEFTAPHLCEILHEKKPISLWSVCSVVENQCVVLCPHHVSVSELFSLPPKRHSSSKRLPCFKERNFTAGLCPPLQYFHMAVLLLLPLLTWFRLRGVKMAHVRFGICLRFARIYLKLRLEVMVIHVLLGCVLRSSL